MTEQLNVQQMAQRLMTADNILILCHKNPDGDTIGCGSALYCALKALDKNVAVLCSDAIPNRYAFTNAHMFKGEFEPQTVVAVDVASVQLFGENNGMTQFSRHVDLCIDHHAGNSGYADFTLLNGSAAAAAELLYEVINAMGVAITPHIADCLYTGLATDTGCFRFSSTTANTHIVAAKLIEAGCHVEELNTCCSIPSPVSAWRPSALPATIWNTIWMAGARSSTSPGTRSSRAGWTRPIWKN